MNALELIVQFDWADGDHLARWASDWADENWHQISSVKWGQWEGLRRQGEDVTRWENFERRLIRWMSDEAKPATGGQHPPRRAWTELRNLLLKEIETASQPPDSYSKLDGYLDDLAVGKAERDAIDQYLRVQRARKFLDLLLMKIRSKQSSGGKA